VWLPEEDLARHVLVVGLTGAHKTTAVTFPALLEAARAGVSVVALDLKYGEDDSLVLAAPEWTRRGRDVLVFAPLDPVSLRWNPLDGCRSVGSAHRLAALLFDDGDAGEPDLVYWMGAERHLCAALCLAVATDGGAPTLERLRRLCEAGPAAVHSYVKSHPAAADLEARLGSYRAMLPKDEAGILQGIASRLEAWGDEMVSKATASGPPEDRIDLDRLRREPILLIVGIPQPALGRLRWLCHLFLRDLASRLLRPRRPDERIRVVEVLEELPAWGRLPGFADYLATLRSRRVSVLATIQSEAQGEHVYGRDGWAAISANLGTKIYFPWLADLDAERLSRALGTTSREEISQSHGWGAGGRRGGEHRRTIQIPLCRPEELQGVDARDDEILARCPRLPPARLWCPPFYARSEFRGRVPDVPPSTAELVVYHHLWYRSAVRPDPQAGAQGADTACPVVSGPVRTNTPNATPQHAADRPGAGGEATSSSQDRGSSALPEDVAALLRFVGRLVAEPAEWDRSHVRPIRRGGRLVELRVNPRVAMSLIGLTNDPGSENADTANSLLRRWAELGWVRQVRPVFVLERRALETIDPALRSRCAEIWEPATRAGSK
jgi:type IV secretory pathway TraG/TraD family ATPase VirD4